MRRVFLIALGAGLLIVVVGALFLGAFPPKITPHEVQKTIPQQHLRPLMRRQEAGRRPEPRWGQAPPDPHDSSRGVQAPGAWRGAGRSPAS